MATWRPARACCARTAFQTSPQHCGTTRESSDAVAWRRITARGTLSGWSNWTAGDVNGPFLIRLRWQSQYQLDVRLTPESGHWNSVVECPLCAKSGHSPASFDHLVGDGEHVRWDCEAK